MDVMRASIRFRAPWILKEARNQREQADFVMNVFDEMNRIDREIATRSSATRSEIMNENYLVLTGQEEYVDPETGEVEVDTNAFHHRWTTPGGGAFFTDDEDANPNDLLDRSDFRWSRVKSERGR